MSSAGSPPPLAVEVLDVTKRYRIRKGLKAVPVPSLRRRTRARGEGETREVIALADIRIAVPAGGSLGLIGGNGAGKSTLLKLIARVTTPTTGKIITRGRVVPMLETGAALLEPDLSVRANISLLARLFGIPQDVADRRGDKVVELAELGASLDIDMSRLSTGEFARLAIAIALELEPDVLLVDEVLSVTDEKFQRRCVERLAKAREDGVTLLVASHDLDLIRSLCDSAALFDDGRIVQVGPAGEIVDAYMAAVERIQPRPNGSDGVKPAGELSQAVITRKGFSPHGRILGGRLKTSRGETAAVRIDEEASLEFDLEMLTAADVRGVLTLSRPGEAPLRIAQPKWVRGRRHGRYVLSVALPPGTLGEGLHTVRLVLAIRVGDALSTAQRPEILLFTAYDPATEDGGERDGLGQPTEPPAWNLSDSFEQAVR